MPYYKTTFFFEGVQQNFFTTATAVISWTETWYQQAASVDAALGFATRTILGSWIDLRGSLLANIYFIKWVRCSNDSNPRESKISPVFPAAYQGRVGADTDLVHGLKFDFAGAAQINCCYLVDFAVLPQGAAPPDRTHHRRVLLRGLHKTQLIGNLPNENGEGWNALLRFCNNIGRQRTPNFPPAGVPSTWLIRYQNPAVPFVGITNLVINANNPRNIDVTAPLGNLIAGQRVAVRSVQQPSGCNRIWTVLTGANNPGPYTLGKSKRVLQGAWINSGVAALISPLYAPANQFNIIGMRMKHTGSSLNGRTRGRRRAV